MSSVSDSETGTVSYTYTKRGAVESKSLPGGGEWTCTYQVDGSRVGGFGASQGDPDQFQEDLDEIYYQGPNDLDPVLLDCAAADAEENDVGIRHYNLKYENEALVSYCQTDYCYDGEGDGYYAETSRSHGRLSKVLNTFHYWENSQWKSYVLSQNVYTYDDVGNRLTNQVTLRDENGDYEQWTEGYGYDELYRLTSVDYGYGDPQTQAYTFDNMGNRLTRNNDEYAYNAANMLERVNSQTQNYFNDENGNTLSGGGRECTWDSQNRLVECEYSNKTSTFTYGADGLRRSMTVDDGQNPPVETDYVLDGQSVVRELQDDDPVATYLVGPRGVEYRQDESTGSRSWYIYDGLGSVLAEVDEDGNVAACRSYDVYGSERWSGGSSTTDHAFVGGLGHTTEDPTGLTYMRARYYDPEVGRFISEDPEFREANWYAYAKSNPVNRLDPEGRESLGDAIVEILNDPWFRSVTTGSFFLVVATLAKKGAFTAASSAMILKGCELGASGVADWKMAKTLADADTFGVSAPAVITLGASGAGKIAVGIALIAMGRVVRALAWLE